MNVLERLGEPTPKFFRKVRNIGLILAAVSGTLLASPVALPVLVIKVASYLGVASMVASAVSQTAICEEPEAEEGDETYGP